MIEKEIVESVAESAGVKPGKKIPPPKITSHTRHADGSYLLVTSDPSIESELIKAGQKIPQRFYRVDRSFMERIGVVRPNG